MATRQGNDSKKLERDDSTVVLFGTDEHGKPRAARFEGVSPDLIKKAAAAMNLQILRPQSASQTELANKLPIGRIHANGTGSVPPVRTGLFAELQLAAGQAYPEAGLPRDWDSIEAGQLVIAQENLAEGLWEAIVIAVDNDMLTFKWRDYPKLPPMSRHRTAVALMNLARAAKA